MALGSFLPFDFGSSFGTILQGIHGFLPPLAGPNGAVPKVHIVHSRLMSSMRCRFVPCLVTLHLSMSKALIWNFAHFVLSPQVRSQQALGRNDRFAMAALVRSRGAMTFSAKDMASVKVPTLGLIGSADANLPAMQHLASILPTLKVVVIEGATHGGPKGVVRRPEFVENFRAFTTAHKEVLSSR
jgi:pimeloyl-ACP methyl ester carboxylesterase